MTHRLEWKIRYHEAHTCFYVHV